MEQAAALLSKGTIVRLRTISSFSLIESIIVPLYYRILQDPIYTLLFHWKRPRLQPILIFTIILRLARQISTLIKHEDGLNQLNLLRADQRFSIYHR